MAVAYDAIERRLLMLGGLASDPLSTVDIWARSYEAPATPREGCTGSTDDTDGDGLAGGADPDCFGRCAPLCPPGAACPATAPRCGDGVCGSVEDYLICPMDCAAP